LKHFNLIEGYFPEFSSFQLEQFKMLYQLYFQWNDRVNVVSRKDIEELYLHHVLHSLAICNVVQFKENSRIIDIGTGGGFPGIPLAIAFPECDFTLVDSINKKINVVNSVIEQVEIKNARGVWARVEDLKHDAHFFVTRAVAPFPDLIKWCRKNIAVNQFNDLPNGIIALKGGDLTEELKDYQHAQVTPISKFFKEDFFETKKIVYQRIRAN
jgi:16S rRNA (guanine527-N7)-methyltransferase